jgi:hypothetical protein
VFHRELRHNALTREVSIRVVITGDTAPVLAATIETIIGEDPETREPGPEAHGSGPGEVVADALRAPGRIRTCDSRFRKPLLYPLSYGGHALKVTCACIPRCIRAADPTAPAPEPPSGLRCAGLRLPCPTSPECRDQRVEA